MRKKDLDNKTGPFVPPWRETPPKPGSYRAIFKWGNPQEYKHPNHKLYDLMKESFGLRDQHFETPLDSGDEKVELPDNPPGLEERHLRAIEEIVGSENVSQSDFDRLYYSSGKTMEEILELRKKVSRELGDLVVHPRNKEEVQKIVAYCDKEHIPITPYGAGSGVNFGTRPTLGGITLVLSTHMNKIISINEKNKSCTLQAGMMGPAYEDALNQACQLFGTKHNYTCGHFPQSFEYSTVGGWIVTWGSGQQSSYYGDAGDLVVSQEYVTPAGSFSTPNFSAAATGPRVNDMLKGSEGSYGILVEVTMKIFYHLPQNQYPFAFMFPDWESGVEATREISQGEFGFPGVMRLSDPEETEVGLKLYGVEGTILDWGITLLGMKRGKRSLLLARTEGERGFSKHVLRKAKKICRRHGGIGLTGYPVKRWEHGRYRDPYLREDMGDFGIVIDTLETSVNWDNLHQIHQEVRRVAKRRDKTICMAHASHFYPQGTNLYFIVNGFFGSIQEYVEFQTDIIEAIARSGGSLSHHHGIGRMLGPWLEEHIGSCQFGALKALKAYFDPRGIMNPGGQLGLDLPEEAKESKQWRIDWKKGRRD